MNPGDVIGRALQIYGSQISVLLPAALIIFAIDAVAFLLLGPFAGLLSLVLTTLYQGMVVQLVRDVQDGRRDHTMGELFSSVGPVLLPLLAVSILGAIGIAIGFVLIIIPGLILLTFWSVVAPVTVVERPGVFAAFGRSWQLVKGYGWPVFGTIVLVFLLIIGVAIVGAIVGAALGDVGQVVVDWLLSALAQPVYALTAAVLYFTLLQVKGEAQTGAAAATPTPAAPPDPFGTPGSTGPPTAS